MTNRWTNDFLDGLRNQGDWLADEAVAKMIKDGEIKHAKELFRYIDTNDEKPPHEAIKQSPTLKKFWEDTYKLPNDVDKEQIKRGEDVFMEYGFPALIILLAKSLMEGYGAPNLSIILNLSKNLERHPYHRLIAVLQMVVNVCAYRGFEDGGKAVITAQKVRLLHAGVRHIAAEGYLPDYKAKYQEYVNHEDMLGTLMGFSYLVIEGWRQLGYHSVSRKKEEDYLYLWKVFGVMMGIHPKDQPHSFDYMPKDVDDAKAFYDQYGKRHYTGPKENPDGVSLANHNLQMMKDMIPTILKLTPIYLAPRIYVQHFIGKEGCQRVGVWRLPAFYLLKFFYWNLPRVTSLITRPIYKIDRKFHRTDHDPLIQIMIQRLIDKEYPGGVKFTIPTTMTELQSL